MGQSRFQVVLQQVGNPKEVAAFTGTALQCRGRIAQALAPHVLAVEMVGASTWRVQLALVHPDLEGEFIVSIKAEDKNRAVMNSESA